jgi:SAM-dependent methyltransferase
VRLAQIIGPNYKPCDLVPKRYANEGIEIDKLDLCKDLENFDEGTFAMVMHSHVLEHLPCELQGVFEHTMRILKPGGSFIFALPIAPGITIENLWPDALPEERQKTFGQDDHVRLVGDVDFPRFLARVLKPYAEPPYVVDPLDIADQGDLQRACIPVRRNRLHGNSLFCVKKLLAYPNG